MATPPSRRMLRRLWPLGRFLLAAALLDAVVTIASFLVPHDAGVIVADSLRAATLIMVGVIVVLSAIAMGIYYSVNEMNRQRGAHAEGALPSYVVAISISYTLWAIFGAAEIQGRYLTTRLTWRTPLGFVAAALGVWALTQLITFQHSRLNLVTGEVSLGGAPEEPS